MPSFFQFRSPSERAERWLVAQTVGTVALCSWAIGGRADWAPVATLAASGLSLIPLGFILRARRLAAEGAAHSEAPERSDNPSATPRRSGWRALAPFAPLAFFVLYVGASLLNPSHVKAPTGEWRPRAEWIAWLPTTLDREITVREALPMLAALLQAGAVVAGLRTVSAVRLLAWGLVTNVLLLALVGAWFWFAGAQQILGEIARPGGSFFATFVYKNHWAAFALLGAATAAGLAFTAWDRMGRDPRARDRRLLGFAAVGLIVMTIPLPGSRSGTALAALLVLAIAVAAFRRRATALADPRNAEGAALPTPSRSAPRSRFLREPRTGAEARPRRFGAMLGGAVAALALTAWVVLLQWTSLSLAWTNSVKQWGIHQSGGRFDSRPATAYDTWRMARARPWFGWGVGSFEAVFPLYQGNYGRDERGNTTAVFDAAHCDWMQFPAELGWVGATLLFGATGWVVRKAWQSGEPLAQWLVGGAALIGVYAVGDFPLQNPGVLLLVAVLLAAAWAFARRPHARSAAA